MTGSNYKPIGESEFRKYYERLMTEIMNADMHFKLWKRLQSYTADYLQELYQAPRFFDFTIKAHLDTALMRIFRVMDTHKSSLSIWKFLEFIQKNPELFSTVEKDRNKLEALKQVTDNLKTWRDKAIAHIDREFVLNEIDIWKQYPVQVGQIEEVITTLFAMLNRYSRAYNSPTWARDWPGEDDVQTVMDAIRFWIQNYWEIGENKG